MSRRQSRPRRRPALTVATLGAVLTAGLALAGCSAGTVTQTDTVVSGAPGGAGQTGQMLLRNISLDATPSQVVAPGGQIALTGSLVNQALASDRLVSITTPYAAQVSIEGQPTVPGSNTVRLVGLQGGSVGPAQPDVRQTTTIRAVLRGVTQVMRPGPTYPVTFTFQNQGSVTIPVSMSEPVNGPQ